MYLGTQLGVKVLSSTFFSHSIPQVSTKKHDLIHLNRTKKNMNNIFFICDVIRIENNG